MKILTNKSDNIFYVYDTKSKDKNSYNEDELIALIISGEIVSNASYIDGSLIVKDNEFAFVKLNMLSDIGYKYTILPSGLIKLMDVPRNSCNIVISDYVNLVNTNVFRRADNYLKVAGGKGLIDTSSMFSGCHVKYLDISDLDTSNVSNMGHMFYDCNIGRINISNFDTSNVENMNCMFKNCGVDEGFDLSSFDTSNVVCMSSMFEGFTGTSIDISNLDTSSVIDMSSMFSDCQVNCLNLGDIDTSRVENMSHMFEECTVENIDVSKLNTSRCIDMSHMFYNCGVQYLDVSHFDTSKVLKMDFMFASCQFTNLDLTSFETFNVKSMEGMFYDSRISLLDISSFYIDDTTDIMFIFSDYIKRLVLNSHQEAFRQSLRGRSIIEFI